MTTTKKRTSAPRKGSASANLQKENTERYAALAERYEHLQRKIGGLRYAVSTNENITASDVLRLIDNVIEAS